MFLSPKSFVAKEYLAKFNLFNAILVLISVMIKYVNKFYEI